MTAVDCLISELGDRVAQNSPSVVNSMQLATTRAPPITRRLIRLDKNSGGTVVRRLGMSYYTGNKKKANARIKYTANNSAPSSQFDSPSMLIKTVLSTPTMSAKS